MRRALSDAWIDAAKPDYPEVGRRMSKVAFWGAWGIPDDFRIIWLAANTPSKVVLP